MKIYAGKNKGRTTITYVTSNRAGGIIKKINKQSKKDIIGELGIRRL